MTNTPDMTAAMKDAMAAFPINAATAEDTFKSSAELNEKLSAVTLDAVEKSTAVSSKWTQDTLKGLSDVTKAKATPAEYMQAMTDFSSSYSSAASEHMSNLMEIGKKAQADAIEMMTAASKNFGEQAASSAKSATKTTKAAAK